MTVPPSEGSARTVRPWRVEANSATTVVGSVPTIPRQRTNAYAGLLARATNVSEPSCSTSLSAGSTVPASLGETVACTRWRTRRNFATSSLPPGWTYHVRRGLSLGAFAQPANS